MTSQNTSKNVVQFPEQPELNDAFYHGKDTPEWRKLLQQDFTFMCGSSSKHSKWSPTTFTLDDWIKGCPKGKNVAKAFGFSRHPEAPRKDGPSIVLGASVGGSRTADAMSDVYALGLDIDAGAGLDVVLDKLDDLGVACLVSTTFSHNTTTLSLKHSNVLRQLGLDRNSTVEEIHFYLRDHDPHEYSDEFISQVKIVNPRHQTADGVMIELETPEIEKFRLIFPLSAPINMMDLGPTQDVIKKVFADKICGLAVDLVGVPFDAACTDPSRIFFTGRHPIGRDDWYCAIVRGRGLDWDKIPERDKIAYVKSRQSKGSDDNRKLRTPSGKNLKALWHESKEHLMLADLIENECPDKVRGNPKQGLVEVECPREGFHTKAGGTGCFAINCLDSESETFVWKCQHDACQGYGTLDFIHDALELGWFDEEHLYSDEYLLLAGEEVASLPTSLTEDEIADDIAKAGLDQNSTREDVKAFLSAYGDVELGMRQRLTKFLGSANRKEGLTIFTKAQIDAIWKELTAESEKKTREAEVEHRLTTPTPEIEVLDKATEESVNAAANAAKWLPNGSTYKNSWFGFIEFDDNGNKKFVPVMRAFELVYCADGVKGTSRGNQITIRYPHRSAHMGIVESVYKIGDVYRESGSILSRLTEEGLEFHPNTKTEHILVILRAVRSDTDTIFVEKSGFTSDKTTYVSPTGEVTTNTGQRFVLDTQMRVSAEKRGDLLQWKEAALTAVSGKNGVHFLPGFLLSPVGCLVDFLDHPLSVVVANEGESNRGKSTSLFAGVSWITVPASEGLVVTGNVTPTSVETVAQKANGAGGVLDEEGASQNTPEQIQEQIMMLASGQGRVRGKPDGGNRDVATWCGAYGTSTENGFVQRMEAAIAKDNSIALKTGAVSRVLSVNFDSAEKLDPVKDSELLAAYKLLAEGKVYGWAMPIFSHKVLELGVEEVQRRVDDVANEWSEGCSGAEMRVVKTVAIFVIAAEISQEAGLLPSDVDLKGMLGHVLKETLDQRKVYLDTDLQALSALRTQILRAINRQDIIASTDGPETARGEILGYWQAGTDKDPFGADLLTGRIYVLPVDRLGLLGVKTDVEALAMKLRGAGGLVEPKTGTRYAEQGLWQSTPNEGNKAKSIRVSGAFVHGKEEEAET
ncbi:MAG: DUF927 domain-containing protein [Paracoccaceae bacterium]